VVTGEITKHDIQVLKAGVANFFMRGKNEIIVELSGQTSLPPDVLRELAVLDIHARELSGRVVLAGVIPELKTQLETLAKPPIVSIFQTRDEAVKSFSVKKTQPSKADASHPVSEAPPTSPTQGLETHEEIRKRELGDMGKLRRELAQIKEENAALRKQLEDRISARKLSFTEEGYIESIRGLQDRITQLMEAKK